jgi:hypothetical protein
MGCCYSIFKKEDDHLVDEKTGVIAHRIGIDDDDKQSTKNTNTIQSPIQGIVNLMKKVTTSSLPFSKDGIRLSSMKVFYNACGGKDKLLGLTTTDVNEKYQKPITAASQLSYCDYLKLQSSPSVGQAVVFISHGTVIITTTNHTNTNIMTTTISMEVHVLGCDRCSRMALP